MLNTTGPTKHGEIRPVVQFSRALPRSEDTARRTTILWANCCSETQECSKGSNCFLTKRLGPNWWRRPRSRSLRRSESRDARDVVPSNPIPLPVAVRVFPAIESSREQSVKTGSGVFRTRCLCSTRKREPTQPAVNIWKLPFLSDGELKQEGLFYADDLPDKDRKTLERYVADQRKRA